MTPMEELFKALYEPSIQTELERELERDRDIYTHGRTTCCRDMHKEKPVYVNTTCDEVQEEELV